MDISFKVCILFLCITASLRLAKGLSAHPNGTIVWDKETNAEQKSNLKTKFDAEGLGPWYDLANSFIDTVLNKEPYGKNCR
jgi:hypothetical protein